MKKVIQSEKRIEKEKELAKKFQELADNINEALIFKEFKTSRRLETKKTL